MKPTIITALFLTLLPTTVTSAAAGPGERLPPLRQNMAQTDHSTFLHPIHTSPDEWKPPLDPAKKHTRPRKREEGKCYLIRPESRADAARRFGRGVYSGCQPNRKTKGSENLPEMMILACHPQMQCTKHGNPCWIGYVLDRDTLKGSHDLRASCT
ncbi:hypothetical protein BDV28DRAFT_148916 [Aspergillus coremiiformis]|uniref:Uncharacterized protein n=1 Tax=Aspergillus coremiiformis TaxID=138285 RepID=A0A5N6Z6R0_9EURO|nr:hypothetical protein BDV28DRAFT_148916 [Aspergillus coremiiformis]